MGDGERERESGREGEGGEKEREGQGSGLLSDHLSRSLRTPAMTGKEGEEKDAETRALLARGDTRPGHTLWGRADIGKRAWRQGKLVNAGGHRDPKCVYRALARLKALIKIKF